MKKQTQPTTTDTDLLTDDEVLREQAMTSGPQKLSRWELRPTAALEISWMQRCKILATDMDIMWRASGFGFIHGAPKATVRAVVNDFPRFAAAVDDWMEKQSPSAQEIADLQSLCLERTNEYFASYSSQPGAKDSSGN
jgi:hypothetical protein